VIWGSFCCDEMINWDFWGSFLSGCQFVDIFLKKSELFLKMIFCPPKVHPPFLQFPFSANQQRQSAVE
jgi:hypothetical protein